MARMKAALSSMKQHAYETRKELDSQVAQREAALIVLEDVAQRLTENNSELQQDLAKSTHRVQELEVRNRLAEEDRMNPPGGRS
jgi:hypothetical protein